jgi:hypothetical protein
MDSQELQNKFWMTNPNGVVIDKVKQLIPYNVIFKLEIFSNIKIIIKFGFYKDPKFKYFLIN